MSETNEPIGSLHGELAMRFVRETLEILTAGLRVLELMLVSDLGFSEHELASVIAQLAEIGERARKLALRTARGPQARIYTGAIFGPGGGPYETRITHVDVPLSRPMRNATVIHSSIGGVTARACDECGLVTAERGYGPEHDRCTRLNCRGVLR